MVLAWPVSSLRRRPSPTQSRVLSSTPRRLQSLLLSPTSPSNIPRLLLPLCEPTSSSRPPKDGAPVHLPSSSLQQAVPNCSSDEQARIAECIAAASAFDGLGEQDDVDEPFKGFIDGPHSFRNWDESSDDDDEFSNRLSTVCITN